jgi:carbon-monoxide dehydrogenase medium subunit
MEADTLLASQPRLALKPGELLAGVRVPVDGLSEGGAFAKFTATSVEHALVSVAARLRMEGSRCVDARVVAGALTALPQRLGAVEAGIVGHELTAEILRKAASAAREAEVSKDRRGDVDFRRQVATVLTRRVLVAAQQSAQGGGE